MAVIGVGADNSIDDVTQYQMGRYVSSNEAIWRVFSFPNHERRPTIVHLAVHLENGQRVYFTNKMYYNEQFNHGLQLLPVFFMSE